jgi:hypothetical protein
VHGAAAPFRSAWARARIASPPARIGQIATGASENRAALDRTRLRWEALKQDVSAETHRRAPAAPAEVSEAWTRYADEFARSFASWEAFYRDSYDNLMGDLWPLSDLGAEIERWEATLSAYVARFRVLADREPSSVTTATTAPRAPLAPPSYDPIGSSIRWIAGALMVLGIAWAISSGVSIAPRIPGRA